MIYDPSVGLVPCPDCQCEVCGGVGHVRYDVPMNDERFGKLYPCPANCAAVQHMREARAWAIRKYSELPAEYAPLTFETFDALPPALKPGKEMARWLAEQFVTSPGHLVEMNGEARNWLVLHGPNGRGKTGLAAAVVNALMDNNELVLYLRLADFFEAVQKRYSRARSSEGYGDDFGADTAEEVIDTAKRAPVLVIDEADVPDVRENKVSIFEKVIRFRHGEKLPTLLTTNLNPREFEARWGLRISSVLMARSHWALMDGVSLRPVAVEWSDYVE
jgi:DNA replication protein DnaC